MSSRARRRRRRRRPLAGTSVGRLITSSIRSWTFLAIQGPKVGNEKMKSFRTKRLIRRSHLSLAKISNTKMTCSAKKWISTKILEHVLSLLTAAAASAASAACFLKKTIASGVASLFFWTLKRRWRHLTRLVTTTTSDSFEILIEQKTVFVGVSTLLAVSRNKKWWTQNERINKKSGHFEAVVTPAPWTTPAAPARLGSWSENCSRTWCQGREDGELWQTGQKLLHT